MKRHFLIPAVLAALTFLVLAAGTRAVSAGRSPADTPDLARGAALYDRWFAVLGQNAPDGNHPIWSRQTSSNRSGPDTWRCVTCHGWDYKGADGAYRSGSYFTGFPGPYELVKTMSAEDIVAHLKGKKDPQHNFSNYLDDASLRDLAFFLKEGLIDDSQYIDPRTFTAISGSSAKGQQLYEQVCASCHGKDGATIKFRYEGRDATLGTLAALDPWRFLHKTRFGTPGTPMAIGYQLKWTPQDGRDVLKYAQSAFPTGLEKASPPPVMNDRPSAPPAPPPGGPATNFATGLLTIFGAMGTALGFNILIFAVLIGVIFLIVWALRKK